MSPPHSIYTVLRHLSLVVRLPLSRCEVRTLIVDSLLPAGQTPGREGQSRIGILLD